MDSFQLVNLTRQSGLAADGRWTEFWALARDRINNGPALAKQYLELPIAVKHVWEGYPIVDAALLSLEQGWFQDACLLADATYTDARISGVLNTRINALFSRPMTFKYKGQDDEKTADEENDPAEQEIEDLKKLVRDVTKKFWSEMLPSSGVREFHRWGILVNFGLGELLWAYEPCDDMESGEVFLPRLKIWNPQFVYWRWDSRSYWLVHEDGQVELKLGDGTWMMNLPTGHNHGWLYGAIRALGKLWLDRVFWQQDWARTEEKFALGIIKAFEPADANPADKRSFEGAVTNMPPEATVFLPTTAEGNKFDLEMMTTEQGSTGGTLLVNRGSAINNDIEILLLGQNMTTESTGSSGSRAMGEVHERVADDYVKADKENLTACIKNQMLLPFVLKNWGADADRLGIDYRELVPECTWQVEEEEDQAAAATAFASLSTGIVGLANIKAPIDIRAMLERNKLPVLPEGTEQSFGTPPPPAPIVAPHPGVPLPGKPGLPALPAGKPVQAPPQKPGLKVAAGRMAKDRYGPRVHPGALAGQTYVDRIADRLRDKAMKALAGKRKAVIAICANKKLDYAGKRAALLELYRHTATPKELRFILKLALLDAHLAGRLSVHHDTKR